MNTPSRQAYVPFVSVENMMKIVHHFGIERVLTDLAAEIENDFRRWESFDKTPRVASHSEIGVIELMPTSDGETYGFKYVNGHPANMKKGLQTVTAFGLLADVHTGYPLLLSEMTILTALRTAATSAMAAKWLATSTALAATAPARPSFTGTSCCGRQFSSNTRHRPGSRVKYSNSTPTTR